jgi:hypothetical protein
VNVNEYVYDYGKADINVHSEAVHVTVHGVTIAFCQEKQEVYRIVGMFTE